MKTNYLIAAAAALTVAGAAQAVPSFTFTTITGADTVIAAPNVITFDGSGPAYTLTGNYEVRSTPVNNEAAVPQGAVGNFLVVPTTGAAGGATAMTATLALTTPLAAATTLSLLWGSIDTFNSITINQVVGGAYTISGSAFSPANGTTTARLNVTGLSGISSIVFTDTPTNGLFRALEVDTISIGSAVPEPAIWGMMVLGFGVVGAALRTSRRKVVFA